MKIYFSCSLTGGRADEAIYAAIVDHLHALGHEVLTAHLAKPDVMQLEQVVSPREVYERDVEWIRECDALIAEVSTPSHGVGYEIAVALGLGRPTLCLYRRGARVSKMILGNTERTIAVEDYEDEAGLLEAVRAFLARLSA